MKKDEPQQGNMSSQGTIIGLSVWPQPLGFALGNTETYLYQG